MKDVFLVVQTVEGVEYTHVFSTELLANQAVANVVLKRIDEVEDDAAKKAIVDDHANEKWYDVITTWNEWSDANNYNDEYAIVQAYMDCELPY